MDGGYNGEMFIQEEEINVRNWKKGKLKTKILSKITSYIRWTTAPSTISSRQKQSSASLGSRHLRHDKVALLFWAWCNKKL